VRVKHLRHEDKERYLSFNKLVFDNEHLEDELDKLLFCNPFSSVEEDCFYIEENEQIVSSLILTKKNQKVGNTLFQVGEYDIVGTHPDFRGKGYCKKLMEYSFEAMGKDNIFLCRLIGIPNFYQQFGFEYSVPAYFYNYVKLNKEKLNSCKSEYSTKIIDVFSDDILLKMINIFTHASSENFGSELRSVDYLRYMIEEKTIEKGSTWYGIYDEDDLCGYAWLKTEKNMIIIKEVAVLNDTASESLCSELYNEIMGSDITEIGIRSPLNNAFARYVYKKGATFSCDSELFEGTWAEMYKILDLKKALVGILDLLNERLKQSIYHDLNGFYSIVTENDKATLSINDGIIEVTDDPGVEICIPSNILTPIYTGYKSIEFYVDRIDYPNNDVRQVFNTLFKKGHPYIWTLDINDSLNEITY